MKDGEVVEIEGKKFKTVVIKSTCDLCCFYFGSFECCKTECFEKERLDCYYKEVKE